MILPLILSAMLNCQRWLVADDPWPYAELSNKTLIEMVKEKPEDEELKKEMEFRVKNGLLSKEDLEND